jgi:hypothetical protein
MQPVGGGGQQPADLLPAEHGWELLRQAGERQVLQHVMSLERLDVEEPQPGHSLRHRFRSQLPLTKQVQLVVFSAGWSMLYPIWVVAERGGGMQAALERLTSYSTSLDLVSEVIPAIVFLWAGLFVYLIYVSVRSGGRESLSMARVAGGLSIGFNVLLVVTVALLHYDMPRMLNLRFARHEDFYASARVAAIPTPLALSLFASILCARPFMRSGFLRRLRAGDCEI